MHMDHRKYDDLDKLFQSRLKDENVVKEDWNKPPQAVFDSALDSLSKDRKKKRRRFLFWFLAATIGTGILLVSVHTFHRIQNLETTIATLQTEQEEHINHTTQPQIQNSNAAAASDVQEKVASDHQVTEIITPPGSPSVVQSTAMHGIQRQSVSSLVIPEQLGKGQEPEQIMEVGTAAIQKNNNKIEVPMLVHRKYSIQTEQNIPVMQGLPEALDRKSPEGVPPAVLVYALGGINASTVRMTNTEGAEFSLTGYERYYADLFAGGGLAYEFSPMWAIDLQATYNQMHVESTFEDDIVYDESKEFIDDQGNVLFGSGYDIFTVMGRQSGNLSLVVNDDQIDDQEKMMNQTTIDNSFMTVGLSLGAIYSPVVKDKFTLSIGGGAQFNHILKLEEQMETSISYNSALLFRETAEVDPMEKANRNYWSLYGQVRLGYALSDHYGFKLDIASAHSLSSIRKTSGPSDSKTYINNLRTALMFYYAF